jgi:hypothetical protein
LRQFTEELQQISAIPYNSATPLYEIYGEKPGKTFGTDCVGKLRELISLIRPETFAVISTIFHDRPHFACILDGYYMDPFLFQAEPFRVDEIDENGIEVPTLIRDQVIRANIMDDGKLQVRSIKKFKCNGGDTTIEKILYDYRFDLNNTLAQLPEIDDYFDPANINYKMYYTTKDGRNFIVTYNHKKLKVDVIENNCHQDTDEIMTEFAEAFSGEQGLSLDALREYFYYANESQKYCIWWARKQQEEKANADKEKQELSENIT